MSADDLDRVIGEQNAIAQNEAYRRAAETTDQKTIVIWHACGHVWRYRPPEFVGWEKHYWTLFVNHAPETRCSHCHNEEPRYGGTPTEATRIDIHERASVLSDLHRHFTRWREALGHPDDYECDYRECPVTGQATWFVDPPYQVAGVRYRYNSTRIDFAALGDWCRSLDGQVIVCENDGADWLPFRWHRAVPSCAWRGPQPDSYDGIARVSREVIWTNDFDAEQRVLL